LHLHVRYIREHLARKMSFGVNTIDIIKRLMCQSDYRAFLIRQNLKRRRRRKRKIERKDYEELFHKLTSIDNRNSNSSNSSGNAQSRHAMIGTKVMKLFKCKPHRGVVVSYNEENNYYRVM